MSQNRSTKEVKTVELKYNDYEKYNRLPGIILKKAGNRTQNRHKAGNKKYITLIKIRQLHKN